MRTMLLLLGVLLYSACDLKSPLGEYEIRDCTPNTQLKYDDCNKLNMGKSPMECMVYQCDSNRRCVLGPRDADRDGDPAMGCGEGRDCDDTDPNRSSNRPEICDGIDNNCDGKVDVDNPACKCQVGNQISCKTRSDLVYGGNSHCLPGQRACKASIDHTTSEYDPACIGETLPLQNESCNGKDDNCDGKVDEGYGAVWQDENDAGQLVNHPKTAIGGDCYAGVGVCRRKGTVICNQMQTDAVCNANPGPQIPGWQSQLFTLPNEPGVIKHGWDSNCDGREEKATCYGAPWTCYEMMPGSPPIFSTNVCATESKKICEATSQGYCTHGAEVSFCGECGAKATRFPCNLEWRGTYWGCTSVNPAQDTAATVGCR